MAKLDFKVGDRVKRIEMDGPVGTVKQIREESIRGMLKADTEAPGLTVTVLWDNGTESHFVPEGLQVSK